MSTSAGLLAIKSVTRLDQLIADAKAAIGELGWHTEGKVLGKAYPNGAEVEPHAPGLVGELAAYARTKRTWRRGVVVGHRDGLFAVLLTDPVDNSVHDFLEYRIVRVRGDQMRIAR